MRNMKRITFITYLRGSFLKVLGVTDLNASACPPGVTRDSILQICRKKPGVRVSERTIRVPELREAAAEGKTTNHI